MSVTLLAEIDGEHVPLTKCDWVWWGPCGCPWGVTVASYARTEEAAWKSFRRTRRDVERAQRRGERMELITHDRWKREVMELMKAGPCRCGEVAS